MGKRRIERDITMKLSIIIRTWDRLEYLIRTIVSIDERVGINKNFYEIIVVDQGSTDGTREWLANTRDEGYYPIRPLFLDSNIGDGRGMQVGIEHATGDFISQLDNDIELITPAYYNKLIAIYEELERNENKVCAISGSHRQGINDNSAPMRFGKKRFKKGHTSFVYSYKDLDDIQEATLYYSAWVTAAFIFRKKFAEHKFDKNMCNSWCGHWWDEGYDIFMCEDIKFWHIDSTASGGEYVKKQAKKFPSYSYIQKHYSRFI